MATETKRILRINGNPADIQSGQICIESAADAYQGKRALAWRDHGGTTGVCIARDEPARVSALRVTTVDEGIATVDTDGDLGSITIDDLRGELGIGLGDPDLGLKVHATIPASSTNFVVDTLLYTDLTDIGGTGDTLLRSVQIEYLFSVTQLSVTPPGPTPNIIKTVFGDPAPRNSSFEAMVAGVGPLPVITETLYIDRFDVDFGEAVSEAIALQVTIYQNATEGEDPGLRTTDATYLNTTSWTIGSTNTAAVAGSLTVTVPSGLYSNNQEAEETFPYGLP